MTTFLWILVGSFVFAIILLIFAGYRKEPKPLLILVSLIIGIMSAVAFVIDISIEPVKNQKDATATEEKSEIESFAEKNNMSVEMAQSIETVLSEIDLTDKTRTGVFQYSLSDVYSWERLDDWEDGQRYSAWMAQEHIFYFYVQNDRVVGVRDAHGNVFYTEE